MGIPFAFAALICGCRPAGSLPASRTIAFAFCAIAASIPWTHCDGWPWFCQVVTFTPASFAMRVMWSLIVDDERHLARRRDDEDRLAARLRLRVERRARAP